MSKQKKIFIKTYLTFKIPFLFFIIPFALWYFIAVVTHQNDMIRLFISMSLIFASFGFGYKGVSDIYKKIKGLKKYDLEPGEIVIYSIPVLFIIIGFFIKLFLAGFVFWIATPFYIGKYIFDVAKILRSHEENKTYVA